MADINPITVFYGNGLDLIVEVRDDQGELIDISQATDIVWTLSENVGDAPIVTKNLISGVTIASNSTFIVSILPSDTKLARNIYWPALSVANFTGTPNQAQIDQSYYHEATVTTADGDVYSVISGRVFIRSSNEV